jgi:hypothetical protein
MKVAQRQPVPPPMWIRIRTDSWFRISHTNSYTGTEYFAGRRDPWGMRRPASFCPCEDRRGFRKDPWGSAGIRVRRTAQRRRMTR